MSKVDQFPSLYEAINQRFSAFMSGDLFTTSTDGLLGYIFISNLPLDKQQEYTCNSCKNFLNRFGGLVSISDKGKLTSVLWDETNVPEMFQASVKALREYVELSNVDGVFFSSTKVLGQPKTGVWNHMSITLPQSKVHKDRLQTDEQAIAKKKENFKMLKNGLNAFSAETIEKAITLLESGELPKADQYLSHSISLKALKNKLSTAKANVRDNLLWATIATVDEGYCKVKNGMIGTLFQDIAEELPVVSIIRNWKDKVDPANFMRAQVAPSAGNVKQAEIIAKKLGLISEDGTKTSLKRRYARFDEIPHFLWKGRDLVKKEVATTGLFAGVQTKQKVVAPTNVMNLPKTTMTWDKFCRTVNLNDNDTIEVLTDNPNRFVGMVTTVDEDMPPILKWDDEANRNPFSWYYHGGIDGEIKRRVEAKGGQYENNEIRVSLIWEGHTDLDVHCITPSGKHIYYARGHRSFDGGTLDIDANGIDGKTMTPVENIRWGNGQAREGNYRYYVHNYNEQGKGSTSFKAECEINGKIYTTYGELKHGEQVDIFKFNYVKGQHPNMQTTGVSSDSSWNVPANQFVKVKGLVQSPNLWKGDKYLHSGDHIFFLLEDCKDLSEGKGRGFFVETLKPELHEVRKTLEAYTASTPIEGIEEASACGVGYSKDGEWNLTLKVTSSNGTTRIILIDRFD